MTKDYSFTWFYVAKTLLMFSGALWASCIGEDNERRPSALVEDYARAFLQDVNWYEIADHLIKDYISENQA